MPLRSKYAVIGVLAALLVGGFVWKYGDTTAPVDTSTPEGEEILRGWHDVEDRTLPPVSRQLPGILDAGDGIPAEGTYLVNLWASNCGPCRLEMPWLQRLHDEGEIRLLGVTRDNIAANAVQFLERREVTYPNVRDQYGDFMVAIGDVVPPDALPSSFIVVDGRITWVHPGPFDSYADLRDSVRSHL